MSDKTIKYKLSHSIIDGVNSSLSLFKYDGGKVILTNARYNRSTNECVAENSKDADEISKIISDYELKDYLGTAGVIQIYTDDTIYASVGGWANETVVIEEFKIPGTNIILEKGDVIRVLNKESVSKKSERMEKVVFSSKYWSLYIASTDDGESYYSILDNQNGRKGDLDISINLYKDWLEDEYKIQIGFPSTILRNRDVDKFLNYADKWADAKLFIERLRKILARDGYKI